MAAVAISLCNKINDLQIKVAGCWTFKNDMVEWLNFYENSNPKANVKNKA